MASQEAPPALDAGALADVVRQALDSPAFQLDGWRCAPLPGHVSNPATGGLYRVTGGGRGAGPPEAWALILKIARLTEEAPQGWGTDLLHFGYWEREALAYQSGCLDDLGPNLRAPRCFGAARQPDGSVWLWLEEVRESGGAAWPVARYGLAARHLGEWQGTYLAGRPLPSAPWLRAGWLRSWCEHFAFLADYIPRRDLWDEPLLRAAFPAPFEDRLLRLWAERHAWMGLLDRLPPTLCHFDTWRPNLLARSGTGGREETVALDWQCAGLGPAGEVGNLAVTALMNLEIDPGEANALDAAVWEEYLAGLREAGWRGDPRATRFCYAAYPALRWGLVFPLVMVLPCVRSAARRAEAEARYGRPLEELLPLWAGAFYCLLDLADEARYLAGGL